MLFDQQRNDFQMSELFCPNVLQHIADRRLFSMVRLRQTGERGRQFTRRPTILVK